jgi:hypothetical protein
VNGSILRIGGLDGTHVQTNNREFVEDDNARSEAKWRSAVDELHDSGLIEDRAGTGEMFFVTSPGYNASDSIQMFVDNKDSKSKARSNRAKEDALEFVRRIPDFQQNIQKISEYLSEIGNYRSIKLEKFFAVTRLLGLQHSSGGMNVSVPSRLHQLSEEDLRYLTDDVIEGEYDRCFFPGAE